MDVAGGILGFAALLAVLLMLGKVSAANDDTRTHRSRSL